MRVRIRLFYVAPTATELKTWTDSDFVRTSVTSQQAEEDSSLQGTGPYRSGRCFCERGGGSGPHMATVANDAANPVRSKSRLSPPPRAERQHRLEGAVMAVQQQNNTIEIELLCCCSWENDTHLESQKVLALLLSMRE